MTPSPSNRRPAAVSGCGPVSVSGFCVRRSGSGFVSGLPRPGSYPASCLGSASGYRVAFAGSFSTRGYVRPACRAERLFPRRRNALRASGRRAALSPPCSRPDTLHAARVGGAPSLFLQPGGTPFTFPVGGGDESPAAGGAFLRGSRVGGTCQQPIRNGPPCPGRRAGFRCTTVVCPCSTARPTGTAEPPVIAVQAVPGVDASPGPRPSKRRRHELPAEPPTLDRRETARPQHSIEQVPASGDAKEPHRAERRGHGFERSGPPSGTTPAT
jgi:hypothetical protein